MNGSTLKALRSLLFFTQDEAAIFIGNVTLRSWQYWEVDKRPIPEDVIFKVQSLIEWRKLAISSVEITLKEAIGNIPKGETMEPITVIVYASVDDWMTLPGREPVMWKPHCSAVAELCASFAARSIVFNAPEYANWLNNRPDNETMRGQWASEISAA